MKKKYFEILVQQSSEDDASFERRVDDFINDTIEQFHKINPKEAIIPFTIPTSASDGRQTIIINFQYFPNVPI